jgi:hypothetical protein
MPEALPVMVKANANTESLPLMTILKLSFPVAAPGEKAPSLAVPI